jgi:hypothetical protein
MRPTSLSSIRVVEGHTRVESGENDSPDNTARHEAGHALAVYWARFELRSCWITILGSDRWLGQTDAVCFDRDLYAHLVYLLSGWASEVMPVVEGTADAAAIGRLRTRYLEAGGSPVRFDRLLVVACARAQSLVETEHIAIEVAARSD